MSSSPETHILMQQNDNLKSNPASPHDLAQMTNVSVLDLHKDFSNETKIYDKSTNTVYVYSNGLKIDDVPSAQQQHQLQQIAINQTQHHSPSMQQIENGLKDDHQFRLMQDQHDSVIMQKNIIEGRPGDHLMGKLANDDYSLIFGGTVNVATMDLNLNSDMTLAKKNTEKVKAQTSKLAEKVIVGKAKTYLKPETVAETAVKPMLNSSGEIFLKYAIKGSASKPDVKLIQPKLGSLSDIVKEALKDVAGNVAEQVKDVAKDKAKEKVAEQTDKNKDKAKGKLKKLF